MQLTSCLQRSRIWRKRLLDHLKELDRQVGQLEAQIKAWHRSSELSQKLEKIPGIGPLGASALVASIADARSFDNGRQMSAWIGLVPRQHSSGGQLIHYWGSVSGVTFICARCSFMVRVRRLLPRSAERPSIPGWPGLLHRRHPNVAAVALAKSNALTRVGAPPTTGSSGATTSRRWQRSRFSAANATNHRRIFTDCSGDHAVMA